MGLLVFIAGILLATGSAVIYFRLGWKSLLIFIPAALFPVLKGGYEGGIPLFTIPLITGTTGGYVFRKRSGLDLFLPITAIVFALVFTADFYIIKKIRGYDFIDTGRDEIVQILENSRHEMESVIGRYNGSDEWKKKHTEEINTTLSVLKDGKWIQFAKDMLPFTSFLYSIVISAFSFLLLKKVFLKKEGEQVRALELFRLNDYFVFTLIAGWGAFILLNKTKYPVISVAALNVALAASTLYTIQALGIIKFFIIKKGMPVFLLPLLMFTFVLMGPSVIMFTTILLTGIGSLDLWGDFRKLETGIERNIKE